ncbi:MAG: AAA family ATPase, partial [Bacteroidota bacterium]
MILSLHIQNYALIEALQVDFPRDLTIITGETGAGKSIILGALGLIMGERADTKALFHTDRKCVIEGRFRISEYKLQGFFASHDLDYEDEMIVRREITPSGKTRAFVNDTPTSIKVLQQLSASLIDLHQQFDTLDIHQMGFQLRLLDALGGNEKRLQRYQQLYRQYTKDRQQLEQLQNQSASAQREAEFLQFQLQELEAAELLPAEQAQIESEFASLSHAEDTKRSASEAYQFLCEAESSVLSQLQTLGQSLQGAAI